MYGNFQKIQNPPQIPRFDVVGMISYIFAMKLNFLKIFVSRKAKTIYLAVGLLLVLFIACNDFLMPWYVNMRGQVEVPSVVGKRLEVARAILDSLGLAPKDGDVRTDREYPIGTVINQNPAAGKKVNRGRRIYLTISGGEKLVLVPSLKGRTLRDAKFQIEREGLKLGAVELQPSEQFPENTIIEQNPQPGTKVREDIYVSLVVSQGTMSGKVTVPNVYGKSLTEVKKVLEGQGLLLGNITYQNLANLLPNTVVDQFPRAGDLVLRGQKVDLFIAQGGEKQKEVLED
jgi:beta-lactam-binding protein with PASTA domain